jgi:hypothetical protein
MRKLIFLLFFITSSLFAAQANQNISKKQMLIDAIEKFKAAETGRERDHAASRLMQAIRNIKPAEVDDKEINEIISLLDIPDARIWIPACLGHFKSRAKKAVPKLLRLLDEEECKDVAMTAAQTIRYALKKMGVKPPPPGCRDKTLLKEPPWSDLPQQK